MDPLVNNKLDNKFLVQEVLGTGGLGVVYKALQEDLNRTVAIKMLHQSKLESSFENEARFEREAKFLSSLKHPHIVSVYSFGFFQEHAYIAMEYLQGQTLSELLNSQGIPHYKRVLRIVMQICEALDFAHSQHIVHRDLKPQNIMLVDEPQPDFVKILDFGLSRLCDETQSPEQKLTKTGLLLGSISYMAPETCMGHRADARSDVYSLGCILYESLAGHLPLDADSPIDLLRKQINEVPKPLPPSVSKELQLITFKSLQKEPDKRFQSMAEFAAALKLVHDDQTEDLNLSEFDNNPERSKNSLLISLFSGIFTIATILGATYFCSNKKSPLAQHTDSALLAEHSTSNRAAQINKALELAVSAARHAKEKKPIESSIEMKRTILTLARPYPKKSLNRDFARKDLAILKSLQAVMEAQGCTTTVNSLNSLNVTQITNILDANDRDFLDPIEAFELDVFYSDLAYFAGFDADRSLYRLITSCLNAHELARAQALIGKLKQRKTFLGLRNDRDLIVELIEAQMLFLNGKRDAALQAANQVFAKLKKGPIEGVSIYEESSLYRDLIAFFRTAKDSKTLEQVLLAAKTPCNKIYLAHPDRLRDLEFELSALLAQAREFSRAKEELCKFRDRLNELPDENLREPQLRQVESQLRYLDEEMKKGK